ncbi:MAG TPA: glycosyltransferase family 4 protein [Candidatus Dormibacteraeota bacterium]|nr:glycosyltransferase family 4 protein [Candidatus Dormibacteraeota bacterium]
MGKKHDIKLVGYREAFEGSWDVVHLLDIHWGDPALLSRLKKPLIIDVHDYYWTRSFLYPAPDLPLRWLNGIHLRERYGRLIRRADLLITHSDYVSARLDHAHVLNVGMGIDVTRFNTKTDHASRQAIVLFAGSNYFRKGLVTLWRALPLVRRHCPAVHVLIAGYERPHTLFLARRLLSKSPATILGPISATDLALLYTRAKVLVLPSEIEACGIAPLEALAAGTPPVCSTAGGIPEMIEHDVTGLLCAPGDYRALSRHIVSCLTDSDLANRLIENGRKALSGRLSLGNMVDKIEAAYVAAQKVAQSRA